MALRILLVVIIIILIAFVVIPFFLGISSRISSTSGNISATLIRSGDSGNTWQSSSSSEDPSVGFPASILNISYHPTSPDVVYLGSKESGVWESLNAGESWHPIKDSNGVLKSTAAVYKIAVSPSDPQIIYAAVFQNDRGEVLYSSNAGASFQRVYFVSQNGQGVFDIYIDPKNPDHIYIVTSDGGLLESQNHGFSWRTVKWFGEPLRTLKINPDNILQMYVVSSSGNFYSTEDGGKNWKNLTQNLLSATGNNSFGNFNPFSFLTPASSGVFQIDARDFKTIYFGSKAGVFRSQDRGNSWLRLPLVVPPQSLPVDSVLVHPKDSGTIFVIASNALYTSTDGGEHWSEKLLPISRRVLQFSIDPLKTEIFFIEEL